MDVTPLIATALGGFFVLVGDLTSRVSSRRQSDRMRAIALEDAERAQLRQIERDRQLEMRQRGQRAADAIFRHLIERNVALSDVTDEQARLFALEFQRVLMFESVYILDANVRRYLQLSGEILDMAVAGELHAKSAVFAVRFNCYRWLGVAVRGEHEIPEPTDAWKVQMERLPAAGERFRSRVRTGGFELEDTLGHFSDMPPNS
ncbi:hypothetical protein Daura_31785 [Dactylosporangium aurantiacum]|uniref:Uncharacterized protein n=1 Tax=Dactylosporangium aurantiacum TaxID=35754 RepID=A0A9Q9MA14_9ACTN|nr:hypothetical protein [Dactylosporangium aurantiacum]MDG6109520.1 hypothetical protein [Dactylosporangium aurantiacum]UWZ51323.1 hypothetical protein Daura_31785 [Dactylosporangium aurantiacum]